MSALLVMLALAAAGTDVPLPTQEDVDREAARLMTETIYVEGGPRIAKVKPFRFVLTSECKITSLPPETFAPEAKCFGEVLVEGEPPTSGAMKLINFGAGWRETSFGGLPLDD